MMLGPSSAPTSPPDTPAPTKWTPCRRRAASRRRVSSKWALPPSISTSSTSSSGTSSSMTASVGSPALTITTMRRGRCSEATNSAVVSDGTNVPSSPNCSTSAVVRADVRLWTATANPWRARLRARLRPMTARPVTPISAVGLRAVSRGVVMASSVSRPGCPPLGTLPAPAPSAGRRYGGASMQRCRSCGRPLPERTGAGRRREFCRASCRQLDYVARRRSSDAGLGDDRVIVTRAELEELHDKLYALEAAVEDTQADLAEARTMADVRAAVDHVLEAAHPLVRTRLLTDV